MKGFIFFLMILASLLGLAQSDEAGSKLDSAEWSEILDGREYKEASVEERKIDVDEEFEIPMWVKLLGIGMLVALLVWLLVKVISAKYNRSTKDVSFSIEELAKLEDDLGAIDLERSLDDAIASQNYRLATRILYLIVLRELELGSWIEYRKDKTNMEYIMQMKGHDEQSAFVRVTRMFEFTWYGDAEVDRSEFDRYRISFDTLITKLKKKP